MNTPIDPRVFAPNFDMVPTIPPREEPALAAATPPSLPEPRSMESGAPPPASTPEPPSYGPAVAEPQKTIEINRRPNGAESIGNCNNLSVFIDPASGVTPNYLVSDGQIGNVIIDEQAVSGPRIFAKVTLNTDGTHDAAIVSTCSPSATVKCVLLATIGGDPVTVTQRACGPINVQICRNWYAAAAPFYGISVQ